jgi:hypothetical protein
LEPIELEPIELELQLLEDLQWDDRSHQVELEP